MIAGTYCLPWTLPDLQCASCVLFFALCLSYFIIFASYVCRMESETMIYNFLSEFSKKNMSLRKGRKAENKNQNQKAL